MALWAQTLFSFLRACAEGLWVQIDWGCKYLIQTGGSVPNSIISGFQNHLQKEKKKPACIFLSVKVNLKETLQHETSCSTIICFSIKKITNIYLIIIFYRMTITYLLTSLILLGLFILEPTNTLSMIRAEPNSKLNVEEGGSFTIRSSTFGLVCFCWFVESRERTKNTLVTS